LHFRNRNNCAKRKAPAVARAVARADRIKGSYCRIEVSWARIKGSYCRIEVSWARIKGSYCRIEVSWARIKR